MKTTLFTKQDIEVLRLVIIKQNVKEFNKTIEWNCFKVDKDNMCKALKSIKFNGVADKEVESKEDILQLIIDYTGEFKTKNGTYLLLQFDEQDEQGMHLVYKLNESEEIKQVQNELFEMIIR